MRRREFMGLAAAMPAAAAMPSMAAPIHLPSIKRRRIPADVEVVYKSPHRQPNALQATEEGLWVLDQRSEGYVSLVNWSDGSLIREFEVSSLDGASGLTVDGDDMWINDNHNSLILRCSTADGTVAAKYWCHGQGRVYRLAGDPERVSSPLPPAYPEPEPAGGGGGGGGGGRGGARLSYGQISLEDNDGLGGEGSQGMEFRDGLLYYASLPTRRAYVVDPESWEVQAIWRVPGNRAHGVGWDPSGDGLWISDTNLRAFFRHDTDTGEIVETIQLTEEDPAIHGVTVHDGYMWYCDDVGYICNFQL